MPTKTKAKNVDLLTWKFVSGKSGKGKVLPFPNVKGLHRLKRDFSAEEMAELLAKVRRWAVERPWRSHWRIP